MKVLLQQVQVDGENYLLINNNYQRSVRKGISTTIEFTPNLVIDI
jgi:hypothetical protein